MDYVNNNEDKRALLEKHLSDINTIVSAKLGMKVYLEIEEKEIRGCTHFALVDMRNIKEYCGAMGVAFKEVYIKTFGVWFNEKGVIFEFAFEYEHIDGGSNGARFCRIGIEDDIIKLLA